MNVVNIQSDHFEAFIKQHEIVFLDFWAPWCAPCTVFGKVYEQVAAAYPSVMFAKINMDEDPQLAAALEIQSIPHLLVVKAGVVIYSESGSMPASRLRELVDQAIAVKMTEQ